MSMRRDIFRTAALGLVLLLWTTETANADILEWQSTNVQLLRGWAFELGDRSRTTVTFMHGNRWRYGDTFAFADFDSTGNSYAELHPRLSLGKISGRSLAVGPIKDILIASTFEFASGANRYLFGFGMDWQVPGFSYLKTNVYRRNNPSLPGTTEQMTISWGLPLELGTQKLWLDGFADMTGGEGSRVANELVQASALVDIGNNWGKPGHIMLGSEYIYWNNKFGLAGVDESVFQVQLRYVF